MSYMQQDMAVDLCLLHAFSVSVHMPGNSEILRKHNGYFLFV